MQPHVVEKRSVERAAWRNSRAEQHNRPTRQADENKLTQAIVTLAARYCRYGYSRITALLMHAGWRVGKDRVERIWRRNGHEGSA